MIPINVVMLTLLCAVSGATAAIAASMGAWPMVALSGASVAAAVAVLMWGRA